MMGLAEIALLLVILALPVWTLFQVRSSRLSGLPLVLWVVVIVAIPILGPLAFLIVRPGIGSKIGPGVPGVGALQGGGSR